MWRQTHIDFVTPPFAGHLFPLLELAEGLRDRGVPNLRILSAGAARDAAAALGLAHVDILPGADGRIRAVSDTTAPVGSNPLRLRRQFQDTLALLTEAHAGLQRLWAGQPPQLVIADFTVPVAGVLAQHLGIPWWTSIPSPCVIETRQGTPAYLGGWTPREGLFGRLRDAAGRQVVRVFKRTVFGLAARQLRALGIDSLYRPDGSEVAYSPERILGLGLQEFEFPRDWPASFRFIGPLTASPPWPHVPPTFEPGRPAVLVTLGTHLPWARPRALALFRRVAAAMPECVVHFAHGQAGATVANRCGNFHEYAYIPYAQYLHRYQAVVHHGGTGITYASIQAGVPALVWPHDYDQRDHAARLVYHGLARRLRPTPAGIARDLRVLMNGRPNAALARFQMLARQADPVGVVAQMVRDQFARLPH